MGKDERKEETMTAQQQAEEFGIRVLIGHMAGRNDAILEFMAEEIARGEAEYDPKTPITCFAGIDSFL
jgi:hypothetical protein